MKITEKIMHKWYSNAINAEDTVPFQYVNGLQQIQDFFCHNIFEFDEARKMVSIIVSIKDDMKQFIPDKLEEGGEA